MKRIFDIVLAMVALVILSPVICAIAIVVAFSMGRPLLFRQIRAGLNGRDFAIAKFRSMRTAFAPTGEPLPDAQRVTSTGRILRRFRLDELPEFLQIVMGKMSFVGPRPLPRKLLEDNGILMSRCRVRPGLTGLAQVSGNTRLGNDEKFAIDLYYVDHHTLAMDMAIILATLRTIVSGERRDEAMIAKAILYQRDTAQCERF